MSTDEARMTTDQQEDSKVEHGFPLKTELQRAIGPGCCCVSLPAGGYQDGRTLRSFHSRLWDTPSIPAMNPVKKRTSASHYLPFHDRGCRQAA
jgi:hypothetical protein